MTLLGGSSTLWVAQFPIWGHTDVHYGTDIGWAGTAKKQGVILQDGTWGAPASSLGVGDVMVDDIVVPKFPSLSSTPPGLWPLPVKGIYVSGPP